MALRSEVINCFKKLHKTRRLIFGGDQRALDFARQEINSEFRKNKSISDVDKINELIKYGLAVENELRTTVIQAKEVKPGYYEARILPDTVKLDNIMFNEQLVEETDFVKKGKRQCCNEKNEAEKTS